MRTTNDVLLRRLITMIASARDAEALDLLATSPNLAMEALRAGAVRMAAADNFLAAIQHYAYAGDTALHVAAAAYRPEIMRYLIEKGANVGARNRRGATPLHYAADGLPGSPIWNPVAQSAGIALLIEYGADPNVVDKEGATPLHRAVRTRCSAAARALLQRGADALRPNRGGSTPLMLATRQTGRGGSGSPEAKAEQAEIIRLLECGG
jgi:hypothetical protein